MIKYTSMRENIFVESVELGDGFYNLRVIDTAENYINSFIRIDAEKLNVAMTLLFMAEYVEKPTVSPVALATYNELKEAFKEFAGEEGIKAFPIP